jgi:hypothetical protein
MAIDIAHPDAGTIIQKIRFNRKHPLDVLQSVEGVFF